VRDEQRPDPRDADELHDALMTAGYLTAADAELLPRDLFAALERHRRAAQFAVGRGRASGHPATIWIAAERFPELSAIHGDAAATSLDVPASRASRSWTREDAIAELFRGRLSTVGPATASALGASLGISEDDANAALVALETDGAVLRGRFTGVDELEWCDRRLLARIHRYTLNRLRAEIEPITAADFQRFLFAWHGVDPVHRFSGIDGLRAVVGLLDGFELPASAWERAVLPARFDRYDPAWLDTLCLAGEAGWAHLTPPTGNGADRKPSLRVALLLREHSDAWQTLRFADRNDVHDVDERLTESARVVLQFLRGKGASFLNEIVRGCAIDEAAARLALAALAVSGLVVSDGFAGVRAITRTLRNRRQPPDRRQNPIGRWSTIPVEPSTANRELAIETQARTLLARYGIVFRRLLARETNAATWRSLTAVYRRLEARGEIRGGRFVAGMSGEQFALPEAVERVREIRRSGHDGRLISISAVDPLNLTGILTSDERVRALTSSRLVYRDGVALAAMEGDYLRPLSDIEPSAAAGIATALAGRPLPALTNGFVGRAT